MPAPIHKKPDWIKVKAPSGADYMKVKKLVKESKVATVCEEARCPNIAECWTGGTATFMIMGDTCTRGCRFCNVKTGNPKGVLDTQEPRRLGESVAKLNLEYIVLTSVDRDDLEDEGAFHFAETIRQAKLHSPELLIEVLTPDFSGHEELVKLVVDAKPDVYAHNIETVERLTPTVRDRRAGYHKTLDVLKMVKRLDPARYTKTSIMLGLGETDEEIKKTLEDLRAVSCDVVTFGQYLQPQKRHLRVEKFYFPEEFKKWQEIAESMGFLYVASGPLVRSSYRAGEFFIKGMIEKQRKQDQSKEAPIVSI